MMVRELDVRKNREVLTLTGVFFERLLTEVRHVLNSTMNLCATPEKVCCMLRGVFRTICDLYVIPKQVAVCCRELCVPEQEFRRRKLSDQHGGHHTQVGCMKSFFVFLSQLNRRLSSRETFRAVIEASLRGIEFQMRSVKGEETRLFQRYDYKGAPKFPGD